MSRAPETLAAVLEEQARALGETIFLRFEEREIRYAELNRLTNRVANGLAALGVKPGVGVAIMMPNSPEWLFVYFATQKLGAYAVPVNVALKGEGLRHILDHSDSSILVTHPDYEQAVEAVSGSLGKLRQIVVDASEAPAGWKPAPGWLTLTQVMQASDANPGVDIDGEAMSALMYTSGTTGAPKVEPGARAEWVEPGARAATARLKVRFPPTRSAMARSVSSRVSPSRRPSTSPRDPPGSRSNREFMKNRATRLTGSTSPRAKSTWSGSAPPRHA